MKKVEIKNFLIINCTGSNDSIGLKVNSNFFTQKIQTKTNDNFVNTLLDFLNTKKVKLDKDFTILVNVGPGSFSTIRTSIAVAKGIQISNKTKIYGYENNLLPEFNLKNIQFLIKKDLVENKLIKPVYIS
jgi:tRNA A37 threonylcarbamoyladenosine modification protein TsaB